MNLLVLLFLAASGVLLILSGLLLISPPLAMVAAGVLSLGYALSSEVGDR